MTGNAKSRPALGHRKSRILAIRELSHRGEGAPITSNAIFTVYSWLIVARLCELRPSKAPSRGNQSVESPWIADIASLLSSRIRGSSIGVRPVTKMLASRWLMRKSIQSNHGRRGVGSELLSA